MDEIIKQQLRLKEYYKQIIIKVRSINYLSSESNPDIESYIANKTTLEAIKEAMITTLPGEDLN